MCKLRSQFCGKMMKIPVSIYQLKNTIICKLESYADIQNQMTEECWSETMSMIQYVKNADYETLW